MTEMTSSLFPVVLCALVSEDRISNKTVTLSIFYHNLSTKVKAVQIIVLFNINKCKLQDIVKYHHQNKLYMYCKWHMSRWLCMTVNYNHDDQETVDCV